MIATTANTAAPVRYQTIEQKRAAVYQMMLKHPNDPRLAEMLLRLTPPRQIRQGGRDGIFIGYARTDELFAVDLRTDLRAAGINPWLDMVDISWTGDWRGEVEAAMNRCGIMLMVMSSLSQSDDALQRERHTFMEKGKIVLPVLYRYEPRKPETFLPPVDFRYNYHIGLQTLLRLVLRAAPAQAK